MMDYYWNMPWYGMVLGPIMMIAVLAAIIAVVVLLVRWLGGAPTISPPHPTPEKTPLDIGDVPPTVEICSAGIAG